MKTSTFVKLSVAKIESKSIREWATSEHNAPIVAKLAAKTAAKTTPDSVEIKTTKFSTYLVCVAIGL